MPTPRMHELMALLFTVLRHGLGPAPRHVPEDTRTATIDADD